MYTWGQIRLLLQQTAGAMSPDLIDGFVNTRYVDILDHYPWKGLEVEAVLESVAAYTTGTVSVTQGANTVVGVGTTFSGAMTGQKFQLAGDVAIYTATFVDTGDLTLDRNYEGLSATGAGFTIFQDEYELPPATKTVLSVSNPVTGKPLDDWTKGQIVAALWLPVCPGTPEAYAISADTDEDDPPVYHTLQLTPPPSLAQGFPLRYQKASAGFNGTNTAAGPLPWVSDQTLLNGCRADIRMQQGKLTDAEGYEAKFKQGLVEMVRLDGARRGQSTLQTPKAWSSYRLRRVLR
jgi:hypothetical protein